jgi:beta-galactosidase
VAGGIQLGARAAELAGRPGRLGGRALAGLGGGLQRLSAARLPVADLTGLGERRGAPGTAATIRLAEDAEGWTVRTPRGTVRVQRDTGHLASWVVDGREVLAGPIRPNYWRALTDNDRGFGNIDARLQHVVVDPAWRDVAVQVMDARSSLGRHEASIALAVASPLIGSGLLRYDVAEDGSITVHHGLVPVQDMYRIGVTVQLPEVHSIRWYGKGPHENYIDRNRGAFTAVHELPIAGMPHHYIRPQENGNRTEVRWLEAIAADRMVRVEDVTGARLGFTAWPWTQEHLDAVEDDHDLVAGPEVTLNIDRR